MGGGGGGAIAPPCSAAPVSKLGLTPDLLCTCHEQTPAFVQHQHRTEIGRTLTHSLDLGRIPLVSFFSTASYQTCISDIKEQSVGKF